MQGKLNSERVHVTVAAGMPHYTINLPNLWVELQYYLGVIHELIVRISEVRVLCDM